MKAVEWLIGAGLHPKANATTRRVAEDLAARMDYTTGHVRYGLAGMVERLGVCRSQICEHIRYLRELGALAWVERGTQTNVRRAQGLPGYAATATVYAAVIPASYDDAMGHTIVGSGYSARIIIDQRGQAPKPVDTRGNSPVDNSASEAHRTPSRTGVKEVGQVQIVGGFTTTATRTRNDSTPNPAPKRSGKRRATILGNTVSAAGMQWGDKLAHAIRRRVPWTRNASHDQLRWVCADMAEQAWTEDQAVRFVVEAGHTHKAGYGWDPARPHRLIAAALLADAQQQKDAAEMQEALSQAVSWQDSTAGLEAAAARAALAKLFGEPEPEPKQAYTAAEKLRARMDWNVWPEVLDHLAEDQDEAIDLYGERLCKYAIDQGARTRTDDYAY
jgi:hypothetical protein